MFAITKTTIRILFKKWYYLLLVLFIYMLANAIDLF